MKKVNEDPEFIPSIKYEKEKAIISSFWDDVSKTLLKNRMVLLAGEIDLEIATDTTKELMYVSFTNSSDKPITVVLNSVGGEVYAGLLIYNTIKDIKSKGVTINVEVRGLAASMGCIILQAGSKRLAARATRFLIHEVAAWEWGKVSEMEDKVNEIRQVNNLLRDIISDRSGKSKEEIDKLWTKKDVWYSAQEAKEFGLIDEILD